MFAILLTLANQMRTLNYAYDNIGPYYRYPISLCDVSPHPKSGTDKYVINIALRSAGPKVKGYFVDYGDVLLYFAFVHETISKEADCS